MNIVKNIIRIPTQKELHPHCVLYMPFEANIRDYVSGAYANLVRSGELTYLSKTGVYQTAPANHPAIGKYGLFHDGAGTNSLLNNRDLSTGDWFDGLSSKSQNETGIDGVANKAWTITDNNNMASNQDLILQSLSVADDNSTHTVFCFFKKDDIDNVIRSLSVWVSGGTAVSEVVQLNTKTGGTYERSANGDFFVYSIENWWQIVISVPNNGTGNTTLNIAIRPAETDTLDGSRKDSVTGSCVIDYPQVELNKSYASSPIETGDSAVSRATQAADNAGNGFSIALSSIPGLEEALGSGGSGKGTMICEIRMEFPEDLGDFTDAGLITSQDGVTSALYATTNDTLVAGDGTNTVTDANAWDRNEVSKLAVRWSGSTFEILRKKADESSWTTTSGTFDGAFTMASNLRLFYDNEYPMWLRNLRFYDKALTDDEIERESKL